MGGRLKLHPGQRISALVPVHDFVLEADLPEYRMGRVQATNGPDVLLIFEKPHSAVVELEQYKGKFRREVEPIPWAWVPKVDCVMV
jgi:hypothetical protein